MARVSKRWVSTRTCGCPDDAERFTDCRYKPSTEKCPFAKSPKARKLWSVQFIDLDTGEIVIPGDDDEIVGEDNPLPEEIVAEDLS
jgi:hypothetical protein